MTSTVSSTASTPSPLLTALQTHAASASKFLLRQAQTQIRNTRFSPLATYLAYKASGLAENGSAAGISVSDFVAVWSPYENGGAGAKKGSGGKKGTGVLKMGLLPAGTKVTTPARIEEKHGREGRPARQSVKFGQRRRHFCRQEGCQRVEV